MVGRSRRQLCEDKTVYKSKNLHAERRRRQKLNDRLLTLRSLVPNITNMKKETVIEDAITYIQQLKGHVIFLSDQLLEMEPLKEEEAKPRIDQILKVNEKCGIEENVEVNIVGENKLLIKIKIEKKRGKFTKLLEAMRGLGFVARDTSVTTFKGATLVSSFIEGSYGDMVDVKNTRLLLLRIIRDMKRSID